MNVTTLLQLINKQHGTVFELLARYSSGEQGAFAILICDGKSYVLKWEADDGPLDGLKEVSLVTQTLRKVGYPAPPVQSTGADLPPFDPQERVVA
jgi:hypothetical protein